MPRDRFAPQSQSRYVERLLSELAQAHRSGFYLSDDLSARTEIDGLWIGGTISCKGGINVEVEERLRYVRDPWWRRKQRRVELVFYRYNAVLVGRGNIFRYNSPHTDHRTFHHVHRYDVLGSGEETVTELRERDVPSLRQVLQEAEAWYWEHLGGRAA